MSMQTFALKFLVCNIVWREIIVGQDFHQFPSHHKKFSHENFDCENLTTCTTHMRMPHHNFVQMSAGMAAAIQFCNRGSWLYTQMK